MFVNKLKMDKVAEAVKKCMDEDELEETGLRKAAYAAHNKGEKMFSFKGKTYPVKVQGEEVSYGEEMKEASCDDEVKKHEKRLHGKDGEVSKHVNKMHKEEVDDLGEENRYRATYHDPDTGEVTHMMDFKHKTLESAKKHASVSRLQRRDGKDDVLHSVVQQNEELEELDEKNVPNSPEKWAQAKSQAKAKFDVYPSAYANGWASKKYKSMGGTWRTESVEQVDEISKSTLASYKDKSSASMKNAQANRDAAEPGKNMSKGFADLHAKSDAIVKKRVKGLVGALQRKQGIKPMGEDVEQIDELSDKQKKIARLADPKDKIDAGDLAKLRGEKTVSEAEKVITPTGMKVYGSSYGNSEKARKDQLKGTVDDIKNPTKSDLDKPMKEGFFKDRLITNYIEEESAFEEALQEVLSKDASAGDYISDFVHSDNPKFAGKSIKKRQKMALAAYYAKKNESVDDSYPVTTDTVAGRMPGGMSNTFKQFKVKLSAKDKEAAETLNQIHNSNPMHMTARDPHIGNGGFVSIPPAGVVRKEEVEQMEESAPKKMDDVAKQDLSPTKKSVTGQVKSDIKNFGRFLAGKKETMESVTNVPFDGPYTKDKPVKNSDGSIQSPMSRARELAKQAMKRVKSNVQGKPSKKD